MGSQNSVTVNIGSSYPIFKRVGDRLVQLEKQEPGKRYALKVNLPPQETYYLQFTEQEEADADQAQREWEAGAAEREAEALRQQREAEIFEESLKYETKIVAFIDILGWGKEVSKGGSDTNVVKNLGKTLATLKFLTEFFNRFGKNLADNAQYKGGPVMTQFSDCIVMSVYDDRIGKGHLEQALNILTSRLAHSGFLVRGGVVKGFIYHTDDLVFGPALNEAYKLESTVAYSPRVILSHELASKWKNLEEIGGGVPWITSPDGYCFFNFLPPFSGSPFFFSNEELWKNQLNTYRTLIIRKAQDNLCPEDVFAKYEWLAGYFDKVCTQYPPANGMEVTKEMKALRWGH